MSEWDEHESTHDNGVYMGAESELDRFEEFAIDLVDIFKVHNLHLGIMLQREIKEYIERRRVELNKTYRS